jgi:hypothetical protein
MESCYPLGPPGTSSFAFNLPAWSIEYVCGHCGDNPWFECCHVSCSLPVSKNVFDTVIKLRRHARHWHVQPSTFTPVADNTYDIDSISSIAAPDDIPLRDTYGVDASPSYCFGKKGTAQFANWCIDGSITQATHCLVLQSLLQAPVSLYLDTWGTLPLHSINLFLHIAYMLFTTGQANHAALSNILVLTFDLIAPDFKEWPTMPSTIAGFKSHILNPTNQHSLVSILPVPIVYLLPDGLHAYCCLCEIAAFALLLPRTKDALPIPLRLTQLCQSAMMHNFLVSAPPTLSTQCLVSIGLIFWLDGWDPSVSSKNNRSPIHTTTVTLLCIDNLTGELFNSRTFPAACGAGKADHNIIMQALRSSLDKLTASDDIMWSNHHGCWTTVRAHVIAFLMDQPERRGTNCLLGGNSKQHVIFGVSCNFEKLERQFSACPKCVRVANKYLERKEFGVPILFSCRICYGFSLSRLLQHGRYLTPVHSKLAVDTPGFGLTTSPGLLSFEMLQDAWHYALRRFVHDNTWTKDEVVSYFTLLCINKETIDHFARCCCNYLLIEDLNKKPENYDKDVVAYVNQDRISHPKLYQLPLPPSAWSIGTINQRVETIMHLAMNTQKAVFKLVLQWASSMDKGTELKKRLTPLVESVEALRLPYLPCRMFKDDKFGGFVAENYRAMTMVSPWLFQCLLDKQFSPPKPVQPAANKPRDKWTMKENAAWLKVRGIKTWPNVSAADRTKFVDDFFNDPDGIPSLVPDTTPSAKEVRQLVLLLFQVFGALFSTDLKGAEAGNRFDALAVKFLDCVEKIGKSCNPNKKHPIWLSKYGMMGLVRCRQHFVDYTYPHSLYEGGIEGEGMVKDLRPLCSNAVKSGWPLNLMNAYNRQNILKSLTVGFESTPSISSPLDGQHEANGKRYESWADVDYALTHDSPLSIVVIGSSSSWTCHVLVHMFRVTYSKVLRISKLGDALNDKDGFVYHTVVLDDEIKVHDATKRAVSFALMLPNRNEEGFVRFCLLDKDWRFVGMDGRWRIMN